MKFAEKKKAYQELQDPAQLVPDRDLLLIKNPKSSALNTGIVDRTKTQREILWALLDVCTVDEITANRPAPVKKLTIEEMKDITAETGKLAAHVHKVKTLEEKAEIIAKIKELIKDFPEDMAVIMLKLPESIVPDFVKVAEFVEKLRVIDLSKATQPELAAIARGLNIIPPPIDFKADTLRPMLNEFQVNLPKVSESHSDQVIDQMNAEKEELHEKVDELESENEDLQEQLDDAESEKQSLEEQLEEEKKSEATPDPE